MLAGLLIPSGCDDKSAEPEAKVVRRDGQPDYVRSTDDAAMDRAIAKARQTHAQFASALAKRASGQRGFAVKKPFAVPQGGQEHIWINDVTWDGSAFHGVIDNEPVDTKAVKQGDRVTVRPQELSDWMYIDGRRVVGGYTLRVLHYQSTPEEQREFVEIMGLEVPPIDF
jgi:uncharacterized protein YegJ (DUF2314 family)